MHKLQKVCEQLVIMGVVKKSLQTWHLRPDSKGASPERGVESQSVLSATSSILCAAGSGGGVGVESPRHVQ